MIADRDTILARLRTDKVESVTAEYSGSGDDGAIHQVAFNAAIGGAEVTLTIPRDLENAVTDFFYELLAEKYGGWQNGDGASGTFTWTVAEDKLHLIHHEYFTDSNVYEDDL